MKIIDLQNFKKLMFHFFLFRPGKFGGKLGKGLKIAKGAASLAMEVANANAEGGDDGDIEL